MKQIPRHILILLILTVYTQLYGQSNRPKVGLVLSGGGAKGLAHIGVIKEMERAGLYPDLITGTSMGSIIGALYAIGMSPEEIEKLALETDWNQVLTNQVSLDKIAYEEKNYYGRYLAEFPIKNKKVGLPGGLIEGQELTLMLSNLTRSAHSIQSFDDFPIPFACVATNIETGKAKVFRSGSLPEALRASMAIPSAFTPMEIEDELYVDGGLVRNFPVEEAISMGADIVIGVFVSDSLAKKQKLNSMVSVLVQSAFVMSAHDSEEQMKKTDLLIFPDLDGYGTYSFDQAKGIIERGNESGESYYNIFKSMADSLSAYGPPREIIRPSVSESYRIDEIVIAGNNYISDDLIKGKLRIRVGDSVDIQELEERINLLYGTRYFEKIVYRINEKEGILSLKIKEAPRGALKFAVHYDSENDAGIVTNLTARNFIFNNSRMIAEFNLAENPQLDMNFFKYLGKKQNVAASLEGLFYQTEIPSFWPETSSGNNRSVVSGVLRERDLGMFLRLQGTYASNQTFGIKGGYFQEQITPQILDSILFDLGGPDPVSTTFNKVRSRDWIVRGFYTRNNLDKVYFPNKGSLISVNLEYFFDRSVLVDFAAAGVGDIRFEPETDDFWRLELRYEAVFPISPKWAVETRNRMNMSNASDDIQYITHRTHIGGFNPRGINVNPFIGADSKRFNNINFLYSYLALRWQFIPKFYSELSVNYIDSEYPMKLVYDNVSTNDFGAYSRRIGVGVSLSYQSPIGPISFAMAKDQYLDGINAFVNLGFFLKSQ